MDETQAAPILRIKDVVKSYGGLRAVDHASFDVGRESITALIGPNGAGKSTVFNVVTAISRFESGRTFFNDVEITRLAPHRIAHLGLVRTFQLTKTFEAMSVLDNLLVATMNHPGEHLINDFFRPGVVRRRENEAKDRARDILELFSLSSKAEDYAGELSGGQRKLLELARALMSSPEMVLLDEPMAGINPTLGRQLLDHIHRLRDEQGMTFLFVEHDMDVVMNHADRVIVMADGAVIADGLPEDVRQNPIVLEAYLGRRAAPQSSKETS